MPVVHTNKAPLAAVSVVSSGSSLLNGANALSATQDPGASGYGPYYARVRYVFSGAFVLGVPAANASLTVYARLSRDGGTTNFETDFGRSTRPAGRPLCVIPLDSTNGTQTRQSEEVDLPDVPHQVIVMNDLGINISSTWSLTAIPSTDQGV